MLEVRLGDADRAKFGGPEWVAVEQASLDDMPFDQLDPLEQAMDMSVPVWRGELKQLSGRGKKGLAWLARQLSGDDTLKTPGWDAFNIVPGKIGVRSAGDALPPEGGEAGGSESTSTSLDSSNGSPEESPSQTPTPDSSPGSDEAPTA